MKINLWDSQFLQSACSVAWATPQHVEYVRDRYKWEGVTLFTDSWMTNPVVDEVESTHKIGWLHEPGCLWPHLYEEVRRANLTGYRPSPFDTILTYRKDFLPPNAANFTFAPYGGVWVPRAQWGLHPKTKLVSMLYGSKVTTTGHQLRHLIGETYPEGVDYFGLRGQSVNYSPETKVAVHKDYMFSVVVETCRENWLFTEILLDCFALGTIPIFWGCPEIGTFFDERGIISFETIEDLGFVLAQLGPSLFARMRPYAMENLKRVAEYAVTEDWLYHNVLRMYK